LNGVVGIARPHERSTSTSAELPIGVRSCRGMIVISFFLLLALAIPALCIWAAVDASSYPEGAFDAAGTSKTLWIVLPIVGIFVCFVGIIAAVLWFGTFKSRVIQATRGGPGFGPAPS
jgi:hypothetical protein